MCPESKCFGMRKVDDQSWLISFLDYDLGYRDQVVKSKGTE